MNLLLPSHRVPDLEGLTLYPAQEEAILELFEDNGTHG
jgi:hypothetical protein